MTTSVMTIEKLIGYYRSGHLQRSEFIIELAQIVNENNVSEILPKVPGNLQAAFRDWAEQAVLSEVKIIGSELSEAEAQKKECRLKEAIPIILGWLKKNEASPILDGRTGDIAAAMDLDKLTPATPATTKS